MTENKLSHINRFQRFPTVSIRRRFFMPESRHPSSSRPCKTPTRNSRKIPEKHMQKHVIYQLLQKSRFYTVFRSFYIQNCKTFKLPVITMLLAAFSSLCLFKKAYIFEHANNSCLFFCVLSVNTQTTFACSKQGGQKNNIIRI